MIQNRPPQGATLDRSHPLSRGLLVALPLHEPGVAHFRNLQDGALWTPDAGSSWSRDLLGLRGVAVAGQSFLTGPSRTRVSPEFTLEFCALRTTPGTGNSDVFACGTNIASLNGTGTLDTFGGLASQNWASADGFLTGGGWQQIIQRGFNLGSAAATFDAWQNGRALARKIPGITLGDTAAPTRIGAGASTMVVDVIGWVRFWERALSDAEIAALQGGRWPNLARAKTVVVFSNTAGANQTLVAPVIVASLAAAAPTLIASPRTLTPDVIVCQATATSAVVPILGAGPATFTIAPLTITGTVIPPTIGRRLTVPTIVASVQLGGAVVVIGGGAARSVTPDAAAANAVAVPPAVRVARRILVAPIVSAAAAVTAPGRAVGAISRVAGVVRGAGVVTAPAIRPGPRTVAPGVAGAGGGVTAPLVKSRKTVAVPAIAATAARATAASVLPGARTIVVAEMAIASVAAVGLGAKRVVTRSVGVAAAGTIVSAPVVRATRILIAGVARATGLASAPVRRGGRALTVGSASATGLVTAPSRVVGRSRPWAGVARATAGATPPAATAGAKAIAATPLARAGGCVVSGAKLVAGPRVLSVATVLVASFAATPPTARAIPANSPRWWIEAVDVGVLP